MSTDYDVDQQTETEPRLLGLHDYLSNLEALQTRFAAYQFSYSRLLLELGRRTQYVEAANKIVRGMNAQLAAMVQGLPHFLDYASRQVSTLTNFVEERTLRESFKVEHGDHLPDDLCLAVENLPTRWEVFPMSWTSKLNVVTKFSSANGQANGHHYHSDASEPEEVETVPDVDEDLLADARDRVAGGDGGLLASLASI
jgi:autophagy-related protein 17